jgi:hypothetical protein
MDVGSFSHGQESDRKARRRLTDLLPMEGQQAPSGVSFSLGYFSFTPGVLPSALRASFAVRARSCVRRGQAAKEKCLALRRSVKAVAFSWLEGIAHRVRFSRFARANALCSDAKGHKELVRFTYKRFICCEAAIAQLACSCHLPSCCAGSLRCRLKAFPQRSAPFPRQLVTPYGAASVSVRDSGDVTV